MSGVPTIYLARHGETEWSKSGRHTGRTDVPLTARGEADAGRLRDRFAPCEFARVFTSPLNRAARTCELAGLTGEPDPDLMEWDYGDYEGKTTAEVRAGRPGWELFRDGVPGGESIADMTARADRVAARLKALTGTVVVFSHGHFLRVLAARWVGQPVGFARSLLLSTASVSALGFDHGTLAEPAIALWNDDRHLTR
ncbi:MAG: histidine phosphatase family protein [Gemmataceae bacterium]